jgi:hypothetical protein
MSHRYFFILIISLSVSAISACGTKSEHKKKHDKQNTKPTDEEAKSEKVDDQTDFTLEALTFIKEHLNTALIEPEKSCNSKNKSPTWNLFSSDPLYESKKARIEERDVGVKQYCECVTSVKKQAVLSDSALVLIVAENLRQAHLSNHKNPDTSAFFTLLDAKLGSIKFSTQDDLFFHREDYKSTFRSVGNPCDDEHVDFLNY